MEVILCDCGIYIIENHTPIVLENEQFTFTHTAEKCEECRKVFHVRVEPQTVTPVTERMD